MPQTTQTTPVYDCWQLSRSECSAAAAHMREVADDPTDPMHAGDSPEREHLRNTADRIDAGQADPPNWALAATL
jgi:hypothetical protein